MRYRVPREVIARPVQDEVIILDSRTNQYMGLNGPGAVVWSVLSEGGSAATAVEELLTRYEVTPTMAKADVDRLIDELQQLELLTVTS